MITFYFTGVVIALISLLLFLLYEPPYEDECEIDIVGYMIGILLISLVLSLLSWAIVFFIGMMFVFQLVKNKRYEKKKHKSKKFNYPFAAHVIEAIVLGAIAIAIVVAAEPTAEDFIFINLATAITIIAMLSI